jgi:hypothetical protein
MSAKKMPTKITVPSPSPKKVAAKASSVVRSPLPSWFPANKFCLPNQAYVEVHHKDLKQILPINGVEDWCRMLPGHEGGLLILLVSFNMQVPMEHNSKYKHPRDKARTHAVNMLRSLFTHSEDKSSIEFCLNNFPTVAVLVATPWKKSSKAVKGVSAKSIFLRGANVRCLAAFAVTMLSPALRRFFG